MSSGTNKYWSHGSRHSVQSSQGIKGGWGLGCCKATGANLKLWSRAVLLNAFGVPPVRLNPPGVLGMGVPLLRALGAPPDKAGEETWDPEDVDSRTPRINPPPLSTPPPGVENSPGNISKDGDTYIENCPV